MISALPWSAGATCHPGVLEVADGTAHRSGTDLEQFGELPRRQAAILRDEQSGERTGGHSLHPGGGQHECKTLDERPDGSVGQLLIVGDRHVTHHTYSEASDYSQLRECGGTFQV